MKVKIIDILNRVAQEKNVPKKIKYYGVTYELQIERLDYVDDELKYLFDEVLKYGDYLFQHLNDEVEILDNETDEIKELPRSDSYVTQIEDNKNKINELVRAVNKIQKEQVLTKSLNIISDCAKETNCMSD